MAEAAEILNPQTSSQRKFFCHLCNIEVQSVNADFTCPICSGGFIEELPSTGNSNEQSVNEDVDMQDANGMDDLDLIRDEIANILMARDGRPHSDDDDEIDRMLSYSNHSGGAGSSTASEGSTNTSGSVSAARINPVGLARRNRRRPRFQNFDRLDNVLLEILQTLSGGGGGTGETPLGNASMFFMGNPGDYAWGREGIDTIVTQLLNQMDTTGPPPLPKEKIDEIPNVEITQEQVDQKLQCSVCWEDFKLDETVRKLPCAHVYHQNCIVPWLNLHGTCPICRKSLTPEGAEQSSLRNAAVFIRNSSNENNQQSSANSSLDGNLGSSQQSTDTQRPPLPSMPDTSNIFNAIPFSRIFSAQPGTSANSPFSTSFTITQNPRQPSNFSITFPSQPVSQANNTEDLNQRNNVTTPATSTITTNSGSSNSSGTGDGRQNATSSNQNDVHKLDDGNIEYEFD